MEFTDNEKKYLKAIVKKELDDYEAEKGTIIEEISPAMVGLEEKYDLFLKELLKKLE